MSFHEHFAIQACIIHSYFTIINITCRITNWRTSFQVLTIALLTLVLGLVKSCDNLIYPFTLCACFLTLPLISLLSYTWLCKLSSLDWPALLLNESDLLLHEFLKILQLTFHHFSFGQIISVSSDHSAGWHTLVSWLFNNPCTLSDPHICWCSAIKFSTWPFGLWLHTTYI